MTFRNIFGGSAIFVMGICFYYVITSWKNLRGAQWAIVGGLIFTATIYLVSFIMGLISPNGLGSQYFNLLYRTVEALAFPFSLLIYVSIRFKEMIQEVQANAQTVVELSEEKREQALSQQKVLEEEVTRQTGEIRQTLENLKSTQSQLVQSEKMASLGELTAGIAHEIQNPLNFVNNFSEVNKEMLEELKAERLKSKADRDEATQDELINDVITNEEKISLHGSRASSIVKGMLEHSRNTSGKKELTDINALADEYLRLSYHGLRAKDKSFNASFETYFDKDIPAIEIVPQDMGRVLLNLINNAFYAVKSVEKPLVVIKTEQNQNQIIISVTDNGTGIPEDVKSKIFQPFFTTKPTGQGTGLGLSLAYDIVKAHGGEIKIGNPKPGQVGTTFIITLPLSNQTS
ncbi:MAG: GHKL domain-containing protein [Bacteroidetes bacterium]|nr:GHKL domain-containing protein [Bacteroidota bacterium]MBU1373439.1 GHKL domain-containing protein [Bacteroidota bacterium]MBU1483701.1 GHKL domain-containing protein [Bacteroidota bacterium]MBU1761418.1 GHKL domain-containing protein [Bacteroidota bacterium]MBU2045922.1 GHKL domain-containing protein [Bacteroidota bacterium]